MRAKSILISLLALISTSVVLYGQEQLKDSIEKAFQQIESLVSEKEKFPEAFLDVDYLEAKSKGIWGKEKVLTLLSLYTANIYKSTSEANKYNSRALALAESLSYEKGILMANYNSAYLMFVKGDFDGAMQLASNSEQNIDPDVYPNIHADFATLKSDIYTERGEYDMALETGLQLLDRAEKTDNDYLLMKAYAALSHYYLRTENFSKALQYCLRGLDFIIKLKKTQYFFPKIDEIARMTAKLNDPDRALEAYEFYSQLEKEISPPGDYIQSIVYMNMADIYMNSGDFEKAQHHLSEAIKVNYKNNYRFRIPRALILQAKLHMKMKDTINAISNYEKSIDAAEQIDAFDVVKCNSSILINLFTLTNQPSKAKEYETIYQTINDSLFTNEKEQKIAILEARRRIKEITEKQSILELENLAQKERVRTIMIALVFFLIVSGTAIFSYIKVKNKNRLLFNRTIELAEMQISFENQSSFFRKEKVPEEIQDNGASRTKNNHTIDEDIKDIILSKLSKLEKENFFLDPNCNLHQLSEKLKTNSKYLSQVINQEKKSNFNNYINELRITYLLSKLVKDKEFRNSKLSYIAASIGYNNLNTFNSAFKKRQGILPSYFINKLNEEEDRLKPNFQQS